MRSPIKAEPDDRTAADAFRRNVRNCLRHYRLAEALLLAGRDAGALQQVRVAPRRLRSWLTLFGPVVTDLRYAALREELHWLTSEPGVARNLDVLPARRAATTCMTGFRRRGTRPVTVAHGRLLPKRCAADEIRHALRKDAKKRRYGGECLADLFRSPRERRHRRKFIAALEDIHDELDALSDLATAPDVPKTPVAVANGR